MIMSQRSTEFNTIGAIVSISVIVTAICTALTTWIIMREPEGDLPTVRAVYKAFAKEREQIGQIIGNLNQVKHVAILIDSLYYKITKNQDIVYNLGMRKLLLTDLMISLTPALTPSEQSAFKEFQAPLDEKKKLAGNAIVDNWMKEEANEREIPQDETNMNIDEKIEYYSKLVEQAEREVKFVRTNIDTESALAEDRIHSNGFKTELTTAIKNVKMFQDRLEELKSERDGREQSFGTSPFTFGDANRPSSAVWSVSDGEHDPAPFGQKTAVAGELSNSIDNDLDQSGNEGVAGQLDSRLLIE